MTHIAVFASGSGTNAQRITEYFAGHSSIKVALILTNNKQAYVIERAKKAEVPFEVFDRATLNEPALFMPLLKKYGINFIVLAGFLWKIPTYLVKAFDKRIINIHPALLPKYGGKGMYGNHVHKAVLANKEKESGITIHFVNEHYDEGAVVFQAKTPVAAGDTTETLAAKIHKLEHQYYPKVIEKIISNE